MHSFLHLQLLCFHIYLRCCSTHVWHALNLNSSWSHEASNSGSATKPTEVISYVRQMWNMHSEIHDSIGNSPQLYFEEALDAIHKHQHPYDCRQVKFLISQGYDAGFGSEIHVQGVGLAIAMAMNRIYIPSYKRFKSQSWQTPDSICHGTKTLDCYFEKWTNCSWTDVSLLSRYTVKVNLFKLINKDDYDREHSIVPVDVIEKYADDRVLNLDLYMNLKPFRKLIPKQFHNFLMTIPMDRNDMYYWYEVFYFLAFSLFLFALLPIQHPFHCLSCHTCALMACHCRWRALSATYLARPNQLALQYIQQHGVKELDALGGECVSMYVRHGDKGSEMKLMPFEDYGRAAQDLWNRADLKKNKKFIFLGTETETVIDEAKAWGAANNWTILVNSLQQQIFQTKEQQVLENRKQVVVRVAAKPRVSLSRFRKDGRITRQLALVPQRDNKKVGSFKIYDSSARHFTLNDPFPRHAFIVQQQQIRTRQVGRQGTVPTRGGVQGGAKGTGAMGATPHQRPRLRSNTSKVVTEINLRESSPTAQPTLVPSPRPTRISSFKVWHKYFRCTDANNLFIKH